MSCFLHVQFGVYPIAGLVIGFVIGAVLAYGSRLKNPEDPALDAKMGRLIAAACAVVGAFIGLGIQIWMDGSCASGQPFSFSGY